MQTSFGFVWGLPWLLLLLHGQTSVVGFLHPQQRHGNRSPTSTTQLYDAFALFNIVQQQAPDASLDTVAVATNLNNNLSCTNAQQAATALFVNMITPASILAAGMISIGLKAPFQLPPSIQDQPDKVRHIESLRRAYIVVTLISFCSELLAVMWATVAVNQLTERSLDLPAGSTVWELLQRDFDLEWAAVNSHFVIGLLGFMYMDGIRGYIMLLTVEASFPLIVSTLSGVGAALLLMGSIVNRGVEYGGGDGVGYGDTILDLLAHYVDLLYQRSSGKEIDTLFHDSLGPLGLGAILLEMVSIAFAIYAILWPGVDRLLLLMNTETEIDNSVQDKTRSITPPKKKKLN